jgi:GTP pyrophosphokinase
VTPPVGAPDGPAATQFALAGPGPLDDETPADGQAVDAQTEVGQGDSPTRSMPRELSTAEGFGSGSSGPAHAGVRRRLSRFGSSRGGANPVLEPLIKTVRTTHPKADIRLIERAYDVAA